MKNIALRKPSYVTDFVGTKGTSNFHSILDYMFDGSYMFKDNLNIPYSIHKIIHVNLLEYYTISGIAVIFSKVNQTGLFSLIKHFYRQAINSNQWN